jgi:hypothetical protein
MGSRLTSECIVTPMVRFLSGSTFDTMLIVAGSESASHDMKNIAPMTAACKPPYFYAALYISHFF